jgi:PAS domain S-box-containing protein
MATEFQIVGRDVTVSERQAQVSDEKHRLLRLVLDTSPALIVALDSHARIVIANTACAKALATEPEQIAGRSGEDLAQTIVDREILRQQTQEILSGHEMGWSGILSIIGTRGLSPHQVTLHALDRGVGRPPWCILVGMDIGDHLRNAESIRASEHFQREAQAMARIGYWSRWFDGRPPLWSEALFTAHGRDPKRGVPLTIDDYLVLVADNDLQRVSGIYKQVAKDGSHVEYQYRVRTDRGDYRTVRIFAQGERDNTGRVIRIHGACQDVTEWEVAQETLRRAHGFNDAILATTNAMIVVIDLSGVIIQLNQGAEQIIGLPTDAIVGKSWKCYIPPEEWQGVDDSLKMAIAGNRPVVHECSILARNGRRPWIAWAKSVLHNEAGTAEAVVCTGIDLTAQKQAMEAAMRSERDAVIGRMAGRVAHEVNNPLEAIKALIEPLRLRSLDHPTVIEGLDVIDRQVDRIARLVSALLGLVRQRASNRSTVRPSEVLGTVAELFRPRFAKADKHLELVMPSDLPPVCIDADQVQQVVINLLENALAALGASGCARIVATAGAGWLEITVEDNGPGLGNNPERCFQPFFTTKANGTGLGLAVARTICEAHAGWIRGENRQPHGARFRLRLRTDLPIEKTPSAGNDLQGGEILV